LNARSRGTGDISQMPPQHRVETASGISAIRHDPPVS